MEPQESTIDLLLERAETYGKTSFELSKLVALETAAHVVTSLIWRISVLIMISLFVLVLNIGIALWLGGLLGKIYYGFFIVAGFYLIAGIVLHFFLHKWIKTPIINLIIKQALT